MGERSKRKGLVPDFDIVLWGFDRHQVRQCLDDMTTRLEEALSQRDAVEMLQTELCEARVEIARLRRAAEDNPTAAARLSKIMMTAEELRDRAARAAGASREQVGDRVATSVRTATSADRPATGALQPVSAGE